MSDASDVALKLPPGVLEEFAALERRAKLTLARGRRGVVAGGVAAGAAAALYGVSYFLAPSATISAVHVPQDVLALFSDEVVKLAYGGGAQFETALGSLTSLLSGTLFKVALVVGIVMSGLLGALRGDVKPFVGAIFLAGPLLIMPTLFGIVGGGSSEEPGPSARARLEARAELADYDGLGSMLAGKALPSAVENYILDQAKLVTVLKSGKALTNQDKEALRMHVDALREALGSGMKADFSGKSLYALETWAMGGAKTKVAQDWYHERATRSDNTRAVAQLGAWLAAVGLALGSGLLLVARHLKARVERIRPLLGAPKERQRSEEGAMASAELPPGPIPDVDRPRPALEQALPPDQRLAKAQALVERDVGKQSLGVPFNPGYRHETLAESERPRQAPRDTYVRTGRGPRSSVRDADACQGSSSGTDIGTIVLAVGAGVVASELIREDERRSAGNWSRDTAASAADVDVSSCDDTGGDVGSDAGGSDD